MLWSLYVSLSSTLGEEARLPLHVVLTVVVALLLSLFFLSFSLL